LWVIFVASCFPYLYICLRCIGLLENFFFQSLKYTIINLRPPSRSNSTPFVDDSLITVLYWTVVGNHGETVGNPLRHWFFCFAYSIIDVTLSFCDEGDSFVYKFQGESFCRYLTIPHLFLDDSIYHFHEYKNT